jgi:hypothetical protein
MSIHELFKRFRQELNITRIFYINGSRAYYRMLFSFVVTAGPSFFGGILSNRDHHLQGFKSSRFCFLHASSHICCNLTSFFFDWSFRYDLVLRLVYNLTYLPWCQHITDTKKVFILNFIKLSDSPILPDSARNDFRILP